MEFCHADRNWPAPCEYDDYEQEDEEWCRNLMLICGRVPAIPLTQTLKRMQFNRLWSIGMFWCPIFSVKNCIRVVRLAIMEIWIHWARSLVVTVVKIILSIRRLTNREGSFSPSTFLGKYLDVLRLIRCCLTTTPSLLSLCLLFLPEKSKSKLHQKSQPHYNWLH